ncbi:hypothetical protein CTRI78_v000051 [Colletotrichum trifolii]|uniref:Uncharacterized protein n=1 Tax=Colletotrichum trifolii TaxID=5466 RepID=A0A4V3HXK5_COLTR|nr:hypothetical protein CTRI78_v000051 [Colletotrichum trifolii]
MMVYMTSTAPQRRKPSPSPLSDVVENHIVKPNTTGSPRVDKFKSDLNTAGNGIIIQRNGLPHTPSCAISRIHRRFSLSVYLDTDETRVRVVKPHRKGLSLNSRDSKAFCPDLGEVDVIPARAFLSGTSTVQGAMPHSKSPFASRPPYGAQDVGVGKDDGAAEQVGPHAHAET